MIRFLFSFILIGWIGILSPAHGVHTASFHYFLGANHVTLELQVENHVLSSWALDEHCSDFQKRKHYALPNTSMRTAVLNKVI